MSKRVLVACERSQRVTIAFRKRGIEAFSCDIENTEGSFPEWHIVGDALEVLWCGSWDAVIAFPPCTYLTAAGACRMYPKAGQLDESRFKKAMEAREFFLAFWNSNVERIAIENPRPLKCVGLPKETQRIQPYEFGEPWSKLTYLWLKGFPQLTPTLIVSDFRPWVSCGTSRNKGRADKAGFSRSGGAQIARSRTFNAIAEAMAEQWGAVI